jgi:hypothetical protein
MGGNTMNPTEAKRFNELYQHHLRTLKLQGKSQKTIDDALFVRGSQHLELIF